MSTEQEIAAVKWAVWDAKRAFADGQKKYAGDVVQDVHGNTENEAIARAAIAAVNQHRAEQASAGDRDAVEALVEAAKWNLIVNTRSDEDHVRSSDEELNTARAAVLARMQPRAMEITEEMVERAVDGYYRTLCTMAGTAYRPSVTAMRAALEAALAPAPED